MKSEKFVELVDQPSSETNRTSDSSASLENNSAEQDRELEFRSSSLTTEDIIEPLKENAGKRKVSWWRMLFRKKGEIEIRQINFRHEAIPEPNIRNRISNQKYSILTFFPLVLFNQFKFFFNFFYLMVGVSQLIDALKVGKRKRLRLYNC